MTTASVYNFSYLEGFSKIGVSAIIISSLKVGFVAIFETLISAMIAQDKYRQLNKDADGNPGPEPLPFDRKAETLGLSFANILTGVMGGAPCTGVLLRTAANIQYGGESRASQLLNSIYVLLITLIAMPVFVYCPLPVIAAMLGNSAVALGKASVEMTFDFGKKRDWIEVATIVVVGLICVFVDGAVGLAVGLIARVFIRKAFGWGDQDAKKLAEESEYNKV